MPNVHFFYYAIFWGFSVFFQIHFTPEIVFHLTREPHFPWVSIAVIYVSICLQLFAMVMVFLIRSGSDFRKRIALCLLLEILTTFIIFALLPERGLHLQFDAERDVGLGMSLNFETFLLIVESMCFLIIFYREQLYAYFQKQKLSYYVTTALFFWFKKVKQQMMHKT